ncbi:glycosyl hydrolase family 8 [Candidatus Woesebacteria bacterium]|nr:glycosyl hydrolase family 8 [Candidatus Woesebacteria bacterium]MCD8546349.1 glycosyl hydrolase family 8 [Candidatus Woesebacteria bacterium]
MLRNIPFTPIRKDWVAVFLFAAVLIFVAIFHGHNMFHFPYYENDEGVYMSQAWSLVTQGKLAPYTYWYDHAPGGWIFIALWTFVTGGFYTFGFSLNTGRVFMLVLHVVSTLLLMLITRRMTRSNWAAAIAGILFSISPLGLYYQRRILLDNIMVFWGLLSYLLILRDKLKMNHVFLSALCFGIAVLTKENAVFFIPGFLLTLYLSSHSYHRYLALLKWLMISGSVISLYFLYALLKGELFPTGHLLGGTEEHVSLLGTLQYQSSRVNSSLVCETKAIWCHYQQWKKQDPFLMFVGPLANLAVLLIAFIRSRRIYAGLGLLGLGFILFLMRGGVVIDFYIVPYIPLAAAFCAICIHEGFQTFLKAFKDQSLRTGLYVLVIGSIFIGYAFLYEREYIFANPKSTYLFFQSQQTKAQLEAVQWIRDHMQPDDIIIIDNYAYIDLQDTDNPSTLVFPDAEWYWKVDQDPDVREDLLAEDPSRVDLVAQTPQMQGDLFSGSSPLTSTVINNSRIWKSFKSDGWSVEFWRPYYPHHILERSWNSYKDYSIANGKVIDLQQNQITTSEGQSYALLRAVWMNDQETFDEVLTWANQRLRNEDMLYSWRYRPDESGQIGTIDIDSATDADQDIALALLFASRRWNDDSYRIQAEKVIDAIWEHEVKEMNGKYYLLPGPWAQQYPGVVINPSYLAPYSYRIFQEVDPNHNWKSVVDTSYEVLEKCSASSLGHDTSVFLPPEWCEITPSGTARQVSVEEGLSSTDYSYNAIRVPWRVALDYQWNEDPRALVYLEKLSFLINEWQENGRISVAYRHTGEVWESYESAAAYGATIGLFMAVQPDEAERIYETQLKQKFYEDEQHSFWEDPQNYYTQNWAWFGTAMYSGNLTNLWEEM